MDLAVYLETLPPVTLQRLYQSKWTCQAVLRALPPLAKHYVLRLLFVERPIPAGLIDCWHAPKFRSTHEVAVEKLARLQLLKPATSQGETMLLLDRTFQASLQDAVSGRGKLGMADVPKEVRQVQPPSEQLDQYARQQWETLLMYLVGSVPRPPAPAPLLGVKSLDFDPILDTAGLTAADGKGSRTITEKGFRFLLLDTYNQLWTLLREYLVDADRRSGQVLAEAISFMVQLGFREASHPLPAPAHSDKSGGKASENHLQERTVSGHLAQLGLLLPFKAGGQVWLCPTRLSMALTGGSSAKSQQDVTEGFCIVETNYRVYAHTDSKLQHAILRLFIRCECLLPNLFVGTLTRESVTSALTCGITADEILQYLRQHAHPQCASRSPVLPEVVADQVRLWQADTQRVKYYTSTLYHDFPRPEVFTKAASKAKELGAWLWEDTGQRTFAAITAFHPQIRDYIREIQHQ